MLFVTLFNLFAAIFNLLIWATNGNELNLFCFGFSLGISVMSIVNLSTGGWGD